MQISDYIKINAYKRPNGDVGIRNKILIVAVDECCEGISRSIERHFLSKLFHDIVLLTNSYTCMLGGNEESYNQMIAVAENPNVAAVLIVAMGCGSISPEKIAQIIIKNTEKPVKTLICQKQKGTRKTIEYGIDIINKMQTQIEKLEREELPLSELRFGVKCGGSDASSGMASNPSVGMAIDRLIEHGATAIGGELFELLGCEDIIVKRAVNSTIEEKIKLLISNEHKRWSLGNLEAMSIGNCIGGISTIEEKSLGALAKMGTKPIEDVLTISKDIIEKPQKAGFYLSETTMLCGGAGVNFASLGVHIILWTSGGASFENPLIPVIRISANEYLYNEDMDINACGIMQGTKTIEQVSTEIINKVIQIANGEKTAIEGLGYSTMTLYQKDQRIEDIIKNHL